MSDELKEIFGDRVYSYTREMAIADGVLHDVSAIAKGAGFKYPVAVTDALYSRYLEPDEESKRIGQSSSGRIWDMLNHFKIVACLNGSGDTVYFSFMIQNRKCSEEVKVKAVIGPGDSPDPVLTIMLPDED